MVIYNYCFVAEDVFLHLKEYQKNDVSNGVHRIIDT